MTPDLQHVLDRYISHGWADASRVSHDDAIPASHGGHGRSHSAYLLLSSLGSMIQPRSEVQVTARCYRPFRAYKMIVAEDSGRFNLTDLKIGYRSQFTRAEAIALREHVAPVCGMRPEVQPDPIRWPLEACAYLSEVIAHAIIPDGREEDPGAEFEIVLLGEAVF